MTGRPVAPIGTRKLNPYGYVLIKTERGWKLEHRWIMEQALGRPLRSFEHVHHLNHRRDDNRPSNLVVVHASDHSRHHLAQAGHWMGRPRSRQPRKQKCLDCSRTGRKKIQDGRCMDCRAVRGRDRWLASRPY